LLISNASCPLLFRTKPKSPPLLNLLIKIIKNQKKHE
jgi:hypothetical protein